jgi:opacity protein-like surface antigen
MKHYIIILLISGIASLGLAQTDKTGTTAAQVLKIGVGPRAIGMGGAYTASANDLLAQYWNPAGTAAVAGNEAGFAHTALFADIAHDYAGFVTTIGGFGTVGAFASVLSMDEMPVRTLEQPEGTGERFKSGAMVLGLGYARNLTDNFSIGFNAKYISEYIYNMNAAGFAVDIGTMYRIPLLNELRLAASISNFGTKMKLEGRDVIVITPSGAGGNNLINSYLELDQFSLPLIFRFGIAADLVKSEEYRISTEIDAIHPNDHTEYLNLGLEAGWNNAIFLRAGYNSLFEKDTEKGLTLGFGIDYRLLDIVGVKVDYAYQAFGRLKNIQYFSMGVKF